MKGFFKDSEIRKFSLKEKFTYIFKQLYAILQPEKSYDITCIIDKEGISFINKIELPFTGISIKIISENIEITGENFCYQFPPEMLLEIQKRFKKALKTISK